MGDDIRFIRMPSGKQSSLIETDYSWWCRAVLGKGGQGTVYRARKITDRATENLLLGIDAVRAYSEPLQSIVGSAARANQEAKRLEARNAAFGGFVAALLEFSSDSREFAVKVFSERADTDPSGLQERCDRERRLLRSTSHPNLVSLIDAGYIVDDALERRPVLVYPHYPMGSLHDLRKELKGDVRRCLTYFNHTLAALDHLHGKDVFHRDIKPANIFVGPGDSAILGDCGLLSRPSGGQQATATGQQIGAWQFAPPWKEGNKFLAADASFDLYMLGKTLWCICAGEDELPREDWNEPENDLENRLGADSPAARVVNEILAQIVVKKRSQVGITSAKEMLNFVREREKAWQSPPSTTRSV